MHKVLEPNKEPIEIHHPDGVKFGCKNDRIANGQALKKLKVVLYW